MGKANSLSRRPDWEIGVEKDNENETLVKPEWLEVRKTEAVEIIVDGVDLQEEVRKSKVKNDEVVKVIEEMKRAGVKMLRDEEWREIDSIIYKERKVYVPKDEKLRAEIIRLHYDMLIGGHRGQWKMVELVTRSDQGGKEICGRIRCLPVKQKLHRTASRKIDAKLNPRKTLDAYISRLYHQVASSAGI